MDFGIRHSRCLTSIHDPETQYCKHNFFQPSSSVVPMRLIIISSPESLPDEPVLATRILEQFPVTLHLRKPDQGTDNITDYLNRISAALHPRIMVHGHAELLARFNLKGIHFTENERVDQLSGIRQLRRQRSGVCISSAFHRIEDIPDPDGLFDYIFLSPIFDSISKVGYQAAFDSNALKRFLSQTPHTVIALGGINEQRLHTASSLLFKGAATLGAVWQAPDPVAAAGRLWDICRHVKLPGA